MFCKIQHSLPVPPHKLWRKWWFSSFVILFDWIVTRLKTLKALIKSLLKNKETFFQIVPETESNSNSVRYDYKKKRKRNLFAYLILIIKFVIVFKLIIFNKFVLWYYDFIRNIIDWYFVILLFIMIAEKHRSKYKYNKKVNL